VFNYFSVAPPENSGGAENSTEKSGPDAKNFFCSMYEMSQRHPVWVAENHVKPCNSVTWLLENVNNKIILHTSKTIFISNRRISLCYFKKPPLQFRKENGEGEYGNDVRQSRKHRGTVQSPLPRKPCTYRDITSFLTSLLRFLGDLSLSAPYLFRQKLV
jgi:hypothetical protein